jgi:hypothetical protein
LAAHRARLKAIIHQGSLDEAHLIEIPQLFINEYFSARLTTAQPGQCFPNVETFPSSKI